METNLINSKKEGTTKQNRNKENWNAFTSNVVMLIANIAFGMHKCLPEYQHEIQRNNNQKYFIFSKYS